MYSHNVLMMRCAHVQQKVDKVEDVDSQPIEIAEALTAEVYTAEALTVEERADAEPRMELGQKRENPLRRSSKLPYKGSIP